MVGLVLVSHSRQIVEGLAELVRQMAGEIPLAAVGGTADGRIGTDATAILSGIEAVWSEEGVLVLVDLGSAVMSTETALELMDPARSGRVQLSGAPLVEGAIAAGVEVMLGSALAEVRAAAESALTQPKF
ncbi:MAG: dihydroxyacetone kinase phosphoryl donor subunit DhaM [Bacillota bacterium]